MANVFSKPGDALLFKVGIYGDPGTGKTQAALTFPRPALIDSERGWQFHQHKPLAVMTALTFDQLEEGIKAVRDDAGATFDTLVIDSISNIRAREIGSRMGTKLTYKDHADVNNRLRGIYPLLATLPVNVVVIAHEDDIYVAGDNSLKKTGRGAQFDKSAPYVFDFIIQMREAYRTAFVKSRADTVPVGHVLPALTYDTLVAACTPGDLRNAATARAFFDHWTKQGVHQDDILKALGVHKLSQYALGRDAADHAIEQYLASKAS